MNSKVNHLCSMFSCSVLSDLCDPMDCSVPVSSVHGDSPGKNTGVGCHALPQVCSVYFTTITKIFFLTKQNTCALCPVPPFAGPSGGYFHLECNLLTSFRSLLQCQLLRETPCRPVKAAILLQPLTLTF